MRLRLWLTCVHKGSVLTCWAPWERGEDRKAGDGEGEPGSGARVGWLMLFNDT